MRIINPKIDMTIKYECGCEFEFEMADTISYKYHPPEMIGAYEERRYIRCPMCEIKYDVNLKQRIIKD